MTDAYISALRCLACSFSTTELLQQSATSKCEPDNEVDNLPALPPPPSQTPQPATPAPSSSDDLLDFTLCDLPWNEDDINDDENLAPVTEIEKNVVTYISGFVPRQLRKHHGMCEGCWNLAAVKEQTSNHTLVKMKDYKEGTLIWASNPVCELLYLFEQHFREMTQVSLPHPHPRQVIIDSFELWRSSKPADQEYFELLLYRQDFFLC